MQSIPLLGVTGPDEHLLSLIYTSVIARSRLKQCGEVNVCVTRPGPIKSRYQQIHFQLPFAMIQVTLIDRSWYSWYGRIPNLLGKVVANSNQPSLQFSFDSFDRQPPLYIWIPLPLSPAPF